MPRFTFVFQGTIEVADQHKGEELMEEWARDPAVKKYDYDVSEAEEENE